MSRRAKRKKKAEKRRQEAAATSVGTVQATPDAEVQARVDTVEVVEPGALPAQPAGTKSAQPAAPSSHSELQSASAIGPEIAALADVPSRTVEDQVRRRAYDIYLGHGQSDRSLQDWLQAEAEVAGRAIRQVG